MAFAVINPFFQFFDNAGEPLDGGTVETYESGTSTPKVTYQDATLSTPNSTTITLNSAGRCSMFVADGETFKYILKDADGVTIETKDGVKSPVGTQAGIGALLYPRTSAEIAAAVTPTNYGDPPGDLRRYGGVGDGTTDCTTALSRAASQAAQTGGATVHIAGGTYRITANHTLAAGINLDFTGGGLLSIDSACTLQLTAGSIIAPPNQQLFTGSGAVRLGTSPAGSSHTPMPEVYPEWWGAKADATTNCTAAISAAITAMQWGGVLKFSAGVYMVSSITAAAGVALVGAGKEQTLIKLRASSSSPFVLLSNAGGSGIQTAGGFGIRDLTLDGNGFAATGCHGVQVNNYANFSIRDCDIYEWDKGVYFHGAISSGLYRCRLHNCNIGFEGNTDESTLNAVALRDCIVTGCSTWGVRATEAALFKISGGSIEANGTAGNPNTGGLMLDTMDRDGLGVAAVIDGVWMESNSGAAGIQITSPTTNYSLFAIRGTHVFGGTRTYGLYVQTSATFAYIHVSHSSFKNAGTTDISVAAATVGVIDNIVATSSAFSSADVAVLNNPANSRYNFPTLSVRDGVTAPGSQTNYAHIYVDSADGDLKVKFADGVVKTLATDT